MEALLDAGYAEFPYELGNFAAQGFKTPTGKVELYSETLAKPGLDPLPDYLPPRSDRAPATPRRDFPLVLLTGAREMAYHHSRSHGRASCRESVCQYV